MSDAQTATATAPTVSKEEKESLGALEEDDEFEEFPVEDWAETAEDAQDGEFWEDNWDDDTVEDDFSKKLKAELDKKAAAAS